MKMILFDENPKALKATSQIKGDVVGDLAKVSQHRHAD